MIEVEETLRQHRAPATSLAELAERIYPLASRILKLEVAEVFSPERVRAYTVSGILDSAVYYRGNDHIGLYIGSSSSEADQRRKVKLSTVVSVLTDGIWVPIHSPEGN